MATLKIDPEFAPYLGGVSEFADVELERQLLAGGGPEEPICVWKGHGIIIGGHRRYKVCQTHGLPFKVREIELADREAVKEWMDRDQFCRRNTSPKLEAAHTARLLAQKIEAGTPVCEAAAEVAESMGVSERTVFRRAAAEKERSEALAKVTPAIREKIESGEVKLNGKALCSLSELPVEHQEKVYAEFAEGEFSSLQQALLGEKKPTDKASGRVGCFRDLVKSVGILKKGVLETNERWPCKDKRALIGAIDAVGQLIVDWRDAE